MGGVTQPGTTIHGTAASPGIPIVDSPQSGVFETIFQGIGYALRTRQYETLDVLGYTLGFKPIETLALSTVSGSPFAVGGLPTDATVTPDGLYVMVANGSSDNVTVFYRNSVTGNLTPVTGSPFALFGGAGPIRIRVSPDGRHVFIANHNANSLSVFAINQTTGFLTAVAGSPFTTGHSPLGIAITPDGKFVMVANDTNHNITVFSRNISTGVLTPIAGSPFAAGMIPSNIVISPDGTLAVVSGSDIAMTKGLLAVFAITPLTGQLVQVPGSPFTSDPVNFDTLDVRFLPDGQHVVAANFTSQSLSMFAVLGAGKLSPIIGSPFHSDQPGPAGSGPFGLAVSPDGAFVLAVNTGTGGVHSNSIYSVDPVNFKLHSIPGSPFPNGQAGEFITVSPDFSNVYSNQGNFNTLTAYQTSSLLTYPLVDATFDPLGGLNGIFRINGQLVVNGAIAPSTASVAAQISASEVGLLNDRGNYDASGNTYPATGGSGPAGAILRGDVWYVSVAGVLNGVTVLIGDTIRALVDTPGQTPGNWSALQVAQNPTGGGTVTSVSVVTANGFAGTVFDPTGASAITLETTVTGLLKGNGTAIAAATPGTDFQVPPTGSNTFYGSSAGASITGGIDNTGIGETALANVTIGTGNIGMGVYAGGALVGGSTNVIIGNGALGANISGTHNLAIGENAGASELGSYTLYIDTTGTGTATPLIAGVFDPTGGLAGSVHINGTLSATNLSGTNTGDQTNISGNAATVTTNANLTGPVTSVGNATAIANGAITAAMLLNGAGAPIILAQSAIPRAIPSSGSIANNGALTLTTAFTRTYSDIYLYFPANAIFAGSAAGLYYTIMSSTTVGTIYQETYTSGMPVIPVTPTPWVTTGPLAYVQSTALEITLLSIVVPGNSMGPNGTLKDRTAFSFNNSAGVKTSKTKFANTVLLSNNGLTTQLGNCTNGVVENRGRTSSQVTKSNTAGQNGTGSLVYGAVNTTVNQNQTHTGSLAVATDWLVGEAFDLEIFYGA